MPEPITLPEPPLDQAQREAIFDFLLLGMYADSVLKRVEDARLYELVSGLGWSSYQDPREYSNTAISRVRKASEDPDRTRDLLLAISDQLRTLEARQFALILFTRLIEADRAVSADEDQLYAAAKEIFGI
jgi:hypothetical protein